MKNKKEESTDNVRSEISDLSHNLHSQFSVDELTRASDLNKLNEKSQTTGKDYESKQGVRDIEDTNRIENGFNVWNGFSGDENHCISKYGSRKDKDETNTFIQKQSCQNSSMKGGSRHDNQERSMRKQKLIEMEKQDSKKDMDDLDVCNHKEDKDTSQNDENKKLEKVKGLLVPQNVKQDKKNKNKDFKLKSSPDAEKMTDTVDNKDIEEHELRTIRSTCDEETSPKSQVDPSSQQQQYVPLNVDLPEKEENEVSVANSFDASEYEGGIEHSWSSECGTPSFMREDNSGSVECREYETDLGRTEKLRLNDHDIEDLSYDTKLKLFNSLKAEIGFDSPDLLDLIRWLCLKKNQCKTCGQVSPVDEPKWYLSGQQPCDEKTCVRSEGNFEKPQFVVEFTPGTNGSKLTLPAGNRKLLVKEAHTDKEIKDLENEENKMKEGNSNEEDRINYVDLDQIDIQTADEKMEDVDDTKREQEDRDVSYTNMTLEGEQSVEKIGDQIKEERYGGGNEEGNKEEIEKFETETKEKKEDQEKDTETDVPSKLAVEEHAFELSSENDVMEEIDRDRVDIVAETGNDVDDKSAVEKPSHEIPGKKDTMEEQDINKDDNVEAREENDVQPSIEKNEFNQGKMDKLMDCPVPVPSSDQNKKKKSKRRSRNREKKKFEQKLSESPENHKDIPKTKGKTRRVLHMLPPGNIGRRCSDSGSNSAGAPNRKKESRKGGDKQSRGNEKESKDEPGKNDDQEEEGEDQNSPNKGDRQGNGNNNNNLISQKSFEPKKRQRDASPPQPNSKRVRKKHSNISNEHWEKFLGLLKRQAETRGCPFWDLNPNPVAACLANCMQNLDDLQDDMLECLVCSTINSLMKHFANCIHGYITCDLCTQIFSLICCHVNECIRTSTKFKKSVDTSMSICEIPLCEKIQQTLSGAEISGHLKMLWFNIRKKLSRVLGDTELHTERKSSVTMASTLESIPEDTPSTSMPYWRPSSRILSSKRSKLTMLGEGVESSDTSTNAAYRGTSIAGSIEMGQAPVTEGRKTRAALVDKHISLPMGPPRTSEGSFLSFVDRPVGIKGIGEVVYGDKNQLMVVAQHWDTKKRDFQENGQLPKHLREEGVILEKYKGNLIIGTTRYQKDFQWVRVSHLGNGITGRCYLATDFETDAKFCVKEIHISNYEMEEISLWAELDHPYIVKIYGATRLSEKIFIFMEYIAGGCLTEAINHQKQLGQRLSQKTALRYFQQLLQVLIYLKSKNILNEDLKGDNILLHKEGKNVSIKVTDFGAARRCQGQIRKGTKPMGTQTQWSPEKAEATGYGFPAEVWAVVCVLVHMLSGTPPWIRRFGTIKTLIVVIVNHSPPIEDIPRNISNSVRDLIERGWTICPGTRPTPESLLLHPAFGILEDGVNTEAYSILPTAYHDNAEIENEENKDLKEIYRKLNDTSSDTKSSHIVPPNYTKQVYPVLHSTTCSNAQGKQSDAAANVENQAVGAINQGIEGIGGDATHVSVGLEAGGATGYCGSVNDTPKGKEVKATKLAPSDPYQNMDYTQHFMSYLHDTSPPQIPVAPFEQLQEYNPDSQVMLEQQAGESFPVFRCSEELGSCIPNFHMLYPSGELGHEGEDSETDEDEEFFKNFDLDDALREMNLSATDERDLVEEKLEDSRAIKEKDAEEGVASEISTITINNGKSTTCTMTNTKTNTFAVKDHERGRQASTQNESEVVSPQNLDSFNYDDLFVSGPPESINAPELGTNKTQPQPSSFERFNPSSKAVQQFQDPQSHFFEQGGYYFLTTSSPSMPHLTGSQHQKEARPLSQPRIFTQHQGAPMPYPQNNPFFPDTQPILGPPNHDPFIRQAPNFQQMCQPHSLYPTQMEQAEGRPTGSKAQNLVRNPQSLVNTRQDDRYDQIWRKKSEHMQPTEMSQTSGQTEIQRLQLQTVSPHDPQGIHYHNQQGQRYLVTDPQNVRQVFNQPAPQVLSSSQPINYAVNHFGQGRHSTPGTDTGNQPQEAYRTRMPGFPHEAKNTYFQSQQPRQKYGDGQSASYVPSEIIIPPMSNQQGGRQNHLQLDVTKAKQGKFIPSSSVQTAPVSSPTKQTKLTSPPYNRTYSYAAPPPHRFSSSTPSPGPKSLTSKSQLEEQERAYNELRHTAKDDLSQHEGSVIDFEEDLDDEVYAELNVTTDVTNEDMESIAAYLNSDRTGSESRIKVVFKRRGDNDSEEIKMSFPRTSSILHWETIIDDELSRHSNQISFGLDRFCLKLEDGSLIDLDSCLGEENVVAYVEPADENDWWWVEKGMIMKSTGRN